MQLLVDYFPLVLFFVAFKWQGIYVATAVAIVASILQIAWLYWRRGKVALINWLSLAIIAVFGGATLILQNDVFIRWKPTVLYGLFGATLAVGKVAFHRDFLADLMKGIVLPAYVWTRLTWSWVAFFIFMGIANWYVAFRLPLGPDGVYPLDTWVNFKVWGGIGLFLAFALAQGVVLARYAEQEAS
jgi:intracellular septation protein